MLFISNNLSDRIKKNIRVNIYVDQSVDSLGIASMKEKLENTRFVADVNYIDKDEAIKNFIRETGEDFRSVLEENPLPRSFVVNFKGDDLTEKNIESVISDIEKIPGVSEVVYDYNMIVRILRFLNSLKYFIYVISVALVLIAIYLVYTNNRSQIVSNTNLYKTFKLVGAKIGVIKIPIILNSIFIGIIAGTVCFLINSLILALLTNLFLKHTFSIQNKTLLVICLSEGVIIALIGSFFASRKLSIHLSDIQ